MTQLRLYTYVLCCKRCIDTYTHGSNFFFEYEQPHRWQHPSLHGGNVIISLKDGYSFLNHNDSASAMR